MHHGAFPLEYHPGRSQLEVGEALAALGESTGLSRRAWLVGAVLIGSGAGAAIATRGIFDGAPGTPVTADVTTPRGSVEWAIAMLLRPDDELLAAGGDIERVSMQHRDDERLVPCFQRLLDLSLSHQAPLADQAGACAARSLGRHRRGDLLSAAHSRLEGRSDRPETLEATERWLDRLQRSRR